MHSANKGLRISAVVVVITAIVPLACVKASSGPCLSARHCAIPPTYAGTGGQRGDRLPTSLLSNQHQSLVSVSLVLAPTPKSRAVPCPVPCLIRQHLTSLNDQRHKTAVVDILRLGRGCGRRVRQKPDGNHLGNAVRPAEDQHLHTSKQ